MNDDPMATSKLAEGIRGFSADLVKLETTVRERLGVSPAPTITPAAAAAAPADVAAGANKAAPAPIENGGANGGAGGERTEFDQLGGMTTIVADSGEIEAIRRYRPTDATTNPSLIYAAAQLPEYQALVDDAVQHSVGLEGEREMAPAGGREGRGRHLGGYHSVFARFCTCIFGVVVVPCARRRRYEG